MVRQVRRARYRNSELEGDRWVKARPDVRSGNTGEIRTESIVRSRLTGLWANGWSACFGNALRAASEPLRPDGHRHRLQAVKPCAYEHAATLLADFWRVVDEKMNERGEYRNGGAKPGASRGLPACRDLH